MIRFIHIAIIASILFLAGCGTKREYFEPKEKDIYAQIVYTDKLPAPIKDVSRYGAMLENRQIITQDGLSKVILDEGYHFIGTFDNKLLSADNNGSLQVQTLDGKKLYYRKFDRTVVVASVKGDKLAVVDASNSLRLVDMEKDKEYFTNKQDNVYALTSKVAAPYFLNFLVIFPSLDGKLVIADWKKGTLVRDVVISSEPFFSNILYLDVIADRLIAATNKRAIVISPKKTKYLDEDIRDILVSNKKIVIMSNDGRVLIADKNLDIVHEKKFLFAVFVGAMGDGLLYIGERNGHLLTMDYNLKNVKIYQLPEKVENLVYMAHDTIYLDDSLSKLHSKIP